MSCFDNVITCHGGDHHDYAIILCIWERRRRGFAILTPSDEGLEVYNMMEGAA